MSQNPNYPHSGAPVAGQGAVYATPPAAGAVDLGAVLSGMWHRKLLMISIFAVIVVSALAFVIIATPKYTAGAKVLIERPDSPYREPDLGTNQRATNERIGEREVYSQAEVIESRTLAAQVAKELNLANLPEFSSSRSSSTAFGSLLSSIGGGGAGQASSVDQRVMDKLMKNLSVFPVTRSSVIKVEYTSESPKTAADIVNAITAAYLVKLQGLSRDDTAGAVGWLTGQINTLQGKVRDFEKKVEEHRAAAGLVRGQSEKSTLIQEELTELNRQLALAAAARAEAEAKAKAIRKMLEETGSVAASNDVINSNLIQRLREQEIALGRRLAELQTTYLSSHPRIVSARQEIGNVRREIRNEALKIVEGLEQQASITSAREASLRASIGELKDQASNKQLDEVTLRELEREAKAASEQLERLQKRRSDAEARMDAAAQLPGARVIEAATIPSKPSFPKKVPTLLVAIGGAAAIALLVAFLLEAINPRQRAAVMMAMPPAPYAPGADESPITAKSQPAADPGLHAGGPSLATPPKMDLASAAAAAAAALGKRQDPLPSPQATTAETQGLSTGKDPFVLQASAALPAETGGSFEQTVPFEPKISIEPVKPVELPVTPEPVNPTGSQAVYAPVPLHMNQTPAQPVAGDPFGGQVAAAAASAPMQPAVIDPFGGQAVPAAAQPAQALAPSAAMAPGVAPFAAAVASSVPGVQEAPRDVAILGSIAEMPGDLAASVYSLVGSPDAPYAESVKQTARNVATRLNHLSNIGLYVAPTSDLVESTAVATGLARAFAGFGLKTLVIDASASNGEFLTAFGIGAGFGLTEFLNGNVGFADAVVSDGASAAHVMTVGLAGADVLTGATRDRVGAMVEALRQAYDVVIVSGANLAQHPWAGNFAIACDLTLLISPEAAGQSPALAECQAAASMTTSDLGIVLTAGGSAGVALHAA